MKNQSHNLCALDADGFFIGVISCEDNLIPAGCVKAEEPESRYGKVAKWQDGEWVYQTDARILDEAKSKKLAEINHAAQTYINSSAKLGSVPDYEIHTWTIQALEAKAWQANKSAPTPTLDAIASARGVNADELKRKALDKALKFELLTAHVAGLRQAAEDKIRLAQTLEDIAAIQCDFCGPSDTIGIS